MYAELDQEERYLEIAKNLKGYDICCFQEVFSWLGTELHDKLIAYATKAGFLY